MRILDSLVVSATVLRLCTAAVDDAVPSILHTLNVPTLITTAHDTETYDASGSHLLLFIDSACDFNSLEIEDFEEFTLHLNRSELVRDWVLYPKLGLYSFFVSLIQ